MDLLTARTDMKEGIEALSARGLTRAAAWLADCLTGTPTTSTLEFAGTPTKLNDGAASDSYILSKCHFDNREFRRCAHVIDTHGSVCADSRSYFLRCYALYLVR
jgi:hypothetical protein